MKKSRLLFLLLSLASCTGDNDSASVTSMFFFRDEVSRSFLFWNGFTEVKPSPGGFDNMQAYSKTNIDTTLTLYIDSGKEKLIAKTLSFKLKGTDYTKVFDLIGSYKAIADTVKYERYYDVRLKGDALKKQTLTVLSAKDGVVTLMEAQASSEGRKAPQVNKLPETLN